MSPKDADGMANSVDADPSGAVWSGSTMFAQAYLSENLLSLWYINDERALQISKQNKIAKKQNMKQNKATHNVMIKT